MMAPNNEDPSNEASSVHVNVNNETQERQQGQESSTTATKSKQPAVSDEHLSGTGPQVSSSSINNMYPRVHPLLTAMANSIQKLDSMLDPYFGLGAKMGSPLRMILSGVLYAILWVIFMALYPKVQDRDNATTEDVVTILRVAVATGCVLGIHLSFFTTAVIVRAACLSHPNLLLATSRSGAYADNTVHPEPAPADTTVTTPTASATINSSTSTNPPSMNNHHGLELDSQVLVLGVKWMGVYLCFLLVSASFSNPDMKQFLRRLGLLLSVAYALLSLMPRAIRRWIPDGTAKRYAKFPLRFTVSGVLLSMTPSLYVPIMSKYVGADLLVLLFPLVLSFLEYVLVSRVFKDEVCEGHSDAAIAVIARPWAVLFESFRVGMVVLSVNTSGSFQGVINATLLNSVLEVLTRNNLIWISMRLVQRFLTKLLAPSSTPLPVVNAPLQRFKRVYIGCKWGTEFWAEYALMLMKLSSYGYPAEAALNQDTDELVPYLVCGWDVIFVLLVGSAVTDVVTLGLGYWIANRVTWLSIDVPLAEPGPSVVLQAAVWMTVAFGSLNSIGSMGSLAEHMMDQLPPEE